MVDCNIKYCIILNFKVQFVVVYANLVFVGICLYSAKSSTLAREQRFIKKYCYIIIWCSEIEFFPFVGALSHCTCT